MTGFLRTLLCVMSSIVTGAIGSYIASRVDRYLQRRKERKSQNHGLLPVKWTV